MAASFIAFVRHCMKMTRRFPFMATYSQHGPIIKLCERAAFFSFKSTGKGFLFRQNGVQKGNRRVPPV